MPNYYVVRDRRMRPTNRAAWRKVALFEPVGVAPLSTPPESILRHYHANKEAPLWYASIRGLSPAQLDILTRLIAGRAVIPALNRWGDIHAYRVG
jgi:hypothetical protein